MLYFPPDKSIPRVSLGHMTTLVRAPLGQPEGWVGGWRQIPQLVLIIKN